MIDLTPLDVRNKRGDFKKIMRGYDPPEVDVFLELVAERLEALVRENLKLRERTASLQDQVSQQADREQAVQDALVTAQELRADIQAQSQREADHVLREAESQARQTIAEADGEAKRLLAEAEADVRRLLMEADEEVRDRLRGIERRVDQAHGSLEGLERSRARFLNDYRSLLERELDVVRAEEDRSPDVESSAEMDFGSRASSVAAAPTAVSPSPEVDQVEEFDSVEEVEEVEEVVASTAPAESSSEAESLLDPVVEDLAPRSVEDQESFAETGWDAPTAVEYEASAETASGPDTDELPFVTDPVIEVPTVAEPVREAPQDVVHEPAAEVVEAEPLEVADAVEEVHAEAVDRFEQVVEAVDVALNDEAGTVADAGVTDVIDLPDRFGRKSADPFAPAATTHFGLVPSEPTIDVSDLQPEPATVEYELIAEASDSEVAEVRHADASPAYPDVPNLETVLAEAGIEEVVPPPADHVPPPPPVPGTHPDNLILFDPDHKGPNDPGR